MLANGIITKHVVLVSSFILMATLMMATGEITKQMDSGFTLVQKDLDMKVIGKMIYSLAKVMKPGQKGHRIPVSMLKA